MGAGRSGRHLSLIIERQLGLLGEIALSNHAPPSAGSNKHGGRSTPKSTTAATTRVVVPFSWGSMSLLHAPTRFEMDTRKEGLGSDHDDRGRGGGNPPRGQDRLRACQARWRAVRLDRLLSSRVVRALPGYVGSLSLQRSAGIVPTLLRWLEVNEVM